MTGIPDSYTLGPERSEETEARKANGPRARTADSEARGLYHRPGGRQTAAPSLSLTADPFEDRPPGRTVQPDIEEVERDWAPMTQAVPKAGDMWRSGMCCIGSGDDTPEAAAARPGYLSRWALREGTSRRLN